MARPSNVVVEPGGEPIRPLVASRSRLEHASDLTRIAKDMIFHEIPETTYATFAHRGEAKNLDHTVNYIYSTWLAQSGRRHSDGADLEICGEEYDAVSAASVIYYGIPLS